MSKPFVYPGVTLEPSQYHLYDKQTKGRFRLGNDFVTREWKEMLTKIPWDTLPNIPKQSLQSLLQAEIGFRISKYGYNITSVQAIQETSTSCNWYIIIAVEELDDLVVLQITMEKIVNSELYEFSKIEFMGYSKQDQLQLSASGKGSVYRNGLSNQPESGEMESEYHTYGTNMLHRNQIPGSFVLDQNTVNTMSDTDHGTFSKELDNQWPTLLHPDSTKET